MLYSHHFSILRHSRDPQALWQSIFFYRQGVVSGSVKALRQSGKQSTFSHFSDLFLLSVHKLCGIAYGGAAGLTDRLMSKAYAKYWGFFSQFFYNFNTYTCLCRTSRSRRKDDGLRLHLFYLFYCKFIISNHPDIRLYRTDQLIYVIGKTVIIIDQQYHISPSCASSMAFITAMALFAHSSYSFCGTLSATIPAPERMHTSPFFL